LFLSQDAATSGNSVAARNLAVLMPDVSSALPLYYEAWKGALAVAAASAELEANGAAAVVVGGGLTPSQRVLLSLAAELSTVLAAAEDWAALASFLEEGVATAAAFAPQVSTLDAVLVAGVYVSLNVEDVATGPESALAVLGAEGPAGCFPTMGKTRAALMDLWFQAHQVSE
jgi:hypothetical protein